MKKLRKLFQLFTNIIFGISLLWGSYVALVLFAYIPGDLSYKDIEQINITAHEFVLGQQMLHLRNYTKQELKDKIDEKFGNPIYFLIEKQVDDTKVVGCSRLAFRLIELQKDLSNELFAYALTHELTHTSKLVIKERRTEFETFKLLWNDVDLRYYACCMYLLHQTIDTQITNNSFDTNLTTRLKPYACFYYMQGYVLNYIQSL